ncbi:MAG: hypothetical protein ACJAWW_002686 [Sulfurimonas sp.]
MCKYYTTFIHQNNKKITQKNIILRAITIALLSSASKSIIIMWGEYPAYTEGIGAYESGCDFIGNFVFVQTLQEIVSLTFITK